MTAFLGKLALFTLAVLAINLLWIYRGPADAQIPYSLWMVVFFSLITAVFHWLSTMAAGGNPQGFIRFYMGTTALRLFLYIMIIVIYRYYDKSTVKPFAVGFMAHYLLYTIFEVPLLLLELKNRR